ncbi:hypothetical protein RvY_12983 [Ramazzottius varieornatus]|uniref:Uncharacterized protein n=1 Tax=Ramazzottius varieornatus TaxID=947166 RepID=A0A1D1VQE6_RAMVA|nr:hypothetical protein RvY_12983 [Ramazzottius varieornatus]
MPDVTVKRVEIVELSQLLPMSEQPRWSPGSSVKSPTSTGSPDGDRPPSCASETTDPRPNSAVGTQINKEGETQNGGICEKALIIWDFLFQHGYKSPREQDPKVLYRKSPLRQTWQTNDGKPATSGTEASSRETGRRQQSFGSLENSHPLENFDTSEICEIAKVPCETGRLEFVSECVLDVRKLEEQVNDLP